MLHSTFCTQKRLGDNCYVHLCVLRCVQVAVLYAADYGYADWLSLTVLHSVFCSQQRLVSSSCHLSSACCAACRWLCCMLLTTATLTG
jgi:hypothetical protein